jgi:hypothetical protein
MRDIHDIIENYGRFSTVMIVGRGADIPKKSITILTDSGINILGPVDTASEALTIVSQTGADVALVSHDMAERREGADLIRVLADTWGVPSVTLEVA